MKRSQHDFSVFRAALSKMSAPSFLARLVIVGAALASVAVPVPVVAQDAAAVAPDGAPAKPLTDEQKRIDFHDNKLSPRVAKDFPGALASIQQFLDDNPGFDHWQRVQLVGRAGFLLYINTPEAKRAQVEAPSLQVIDDEIAQVKANKTLSASDRERDLRNLSTNKLMLLIEAKRGDQAGQEFDYWWPIVLRSPDWSGNWYGFARQVRHLQNKPQQAVDDLTGAFSARVGTQGVFPTDISLALTDELLAQGRGEEAASWAKLSFLMCPFREGDIQDATKAVTRALSAGELSVAKANLFAQAQTDPAAPNPLAKVPLPKLDEAPLRAVLADAKSQAPLDTRLTCLMLTGDYRGAMVLAKSQLMQDVGNQDNALEVARIFKAKDGGIARANAFLAYYGQGQGDNPIPAFLKETQAAKPGADAAPTP